MIDVNQHRQIDACPIWSAIANTVNLHLAVWQSYKHKTWKLPVPLQLLLISKEEYDEWRYKYPELDTYQKRAKIPSQELSDYLVKELTKKEK